MTDVVSIGRIRPAPPAQGFTAGRYVRLRREAAGLTIAQAAALYGQSSTAVIAAQAFLERVEADQDVLGPISARRLVFAFLFDLEIYAALAARLPHASVCHGCGCTFMQPCIDRGHEGACRWTDADETRCSSCDARA